MFVSYHTHLGVFGVLNIRGALEGALETAVVVATTGVAGTVAARPVAMMMKSFMLMSWMSESLGVGGADKRSGLRRFYRYGARGWVIPLVSTADKFHGSQLVTEADYTNQTQNSMEVFNKIHDCSR